MRSTIFLIPLACLSILFSCTSTPEETATGNNQPDTTLSEEQNHEELLAPEGWELMDHDNITYLGVKDSLLPEEWSGLSDKLAAHYGKIVTHMNAHNISFAGAPLTQWFSWNESGYSVYTAGVPVSPDAIQGEGLILYTIPSGKAFKFNYYGPYDQMEASHIEINTYLNNAQIELIGAPWEVYVTDPGMEPDTSKWLSEIWYPVAI